MIQFELSEKQSASAFTPQGPFFLAYIEAGIAVEFSVRRTLTQALGSMEVYELRDGLYRLLDSTGRVALLSEKKWDVIAEDWSKPEPDELRATLSAYLARTGNPLPEQVDMGTFVMAAASILERLEEEARPRWIKAISRATARLLRHP